MPLDFNKNSGRTGTEASLGMWKSNFRLFGEAGALYQK